ncbi:MAG: PilZ domain-containing protein [Myxococcales bacterium]|nr:PilZ domain-containing protein [Myxococcales bacterium]
MSSKNRRHSNRSPPTGKDSEVRPAGSEDERRRADRWHSDAEVEILSPIQQVASAVDVSKTGIQLWLDHWLSAGTVCDLRITTHSGRTMHKRVRVIWTRREGKSCVSGLEVVGSIAPHTSDQD